MPVLSNFPSKQQTGEYKHIETINVNEEEAVSFFERKYDKFYKGLIITLLSSTLEEPAAETYFLCRNSQAFRDIISTGFDWGSTTSKSARIYVRLANGIWSCQSSSGKHNGTTTGYYDQVSVHELKLAAIINPRYTQGVDCFKLYRGVDVKLPKSFTIEVYGLE